MSLKVNNIAKNTSYFTFALIIQKIISFSYFTILARNLVPEDLGKYYLAMSITTIFAIFIDLGLTNIVVREVAKKQDDASKLLSSVLVIKIPLAILSLIAVALFVNLMGYPEITKTLVYISSICMILDAFTLTFFAVIRGFHNLKFESIASVIFQIIVLVTGLIFLRAGFSLAWLMSALAIASVFNFLFSSFLIKFKFKISLKPVIDKQLIKYIINLAIPFALFGILQRLYMYLDSVFLSVLAGDRYVGLYQIAFKIIFALQFLPMAFTASLYPAFASYYKNNREQLTITFERAMNYLIIISLPISVGIIVIVDKIIKIFKPEYIEATLTLQIIIASLLFLFLSFPIGSLLNACDRQKTNTRNMAITLVVSVILNLILIPKYNVVGAGITVFVTNILMFILGMYHVPSIIKYRPAKNLSVFIKALFAVIIMGLIAFYLKSILNIFLVIIISGLVYFIILLITKALKKEDLVSVVRSFIRRKA